MTTMDDTFVTSSLNAELLPIVLGVIGKIQGQRFAKSLTLLFDTGATSTWINKKVLPSGIQGYTVPAVTNSTLAGTFTSSEQVALQDLVLPEYHSKQALSKLKAKVFHADCRYDMIVGRDVLRAFGVNLDFENNTIAVGGVSRPMREFPQSVEGHLPTDVLLQDFLDTIDPAFNDEDSQSSEQGESHVLEDGFAEILESKYDKVTPEQIVANCTHLTQDQRNDLAKLFSKFDTLFDGKLRSYTDEKIHLDVDDKIPPT